MAQLQVEQIGQAYRFTWPNYLITILVDHLHEGSRAVHSEIEVNTSAPGYDPFLTRTALNLISLPSRRLFISYMEKIFKDADWVEITEQLCNRTLKFLREGEPVLRVTRQMQVEPPCSRLAPLLYDGLPTILFGPGGIGKSYLALFFALLVEIGGNLGGLQAVKGSVLYLDYESEFADFVDRTNRLWRGHPELTPAEPMYRRCAVPIPDDLHNLQRQVAVSDIKLLIVDSLAAAAGGELYAPETAIRLFSALRSLRVSSLILGHVSKDDEKAKSVFGSVFFANYARSCFEMKKTQEAGEAVVRVGLFHKKHNLGQLHRPIGLKLSFADATHIEPLDLIEDPDLAEGLPLKDRIRAGLSHGGKTAKELAEELGVGLTQVKVRLSEGRGVWSIKLGDEQWGLLSAHR